MASAREEFVENTKARLDEWNKRIEELEREIREGKSESKEELRARLQDLREKYDAARAKLEEIRSSDDPWDQVKKEAEHLTKTLKQSINYFRSQL